MTNLHETCISDHLRLKTFLLSLQITCSYLKSVALTCSTYCNAHTEQIWAHHGSCGLQSVIKSLGKVLLINILHSDCIFRHEKC